MVMQEKRVVVVKYVLQSRVVDLVRTGIVL
jgi:hypothetical protein